MIFLWFFKPFAHYAYTPRGHCMFETKKGGFCKCFLNLRCKIIFQVLFTTAPLFITNKLKSMLIIIHSYTSFFLLIAYQYQALIYWECRLLSMYVHVVWLLLCSLANLCDWTNAMRAAISSQKSWMMSWAAMMFSSLITCST